MVFFVRDVGVLARPAPEAVMIRASDYAQYVRAADLITTAQADAAAIVAEARTTYESERLRGYEEGREQASVESAAGAIENVARTIDYFALVEERMSALVLQSMRCLVADYSQHERIGVVVRSALAAVRNQKHVTLRVAADRLEDVRTSVNEILAQFPSVGYLDLQADARLQGDACIVDTDNGTVEASLEGQLEAIRLAFDRVLGRRHRPGQEADIASGQI